MGYEGLTLIEGLSGVLTDDAGIALGTLLCFRGDVVAADALEITTAGLQENARVSSKKIK